MIDDKYIIEHFLGKTDKINRFALQRITEEELNYLKNRYNDSDSLNETILRIKYNIDVHPHCKTCGKKIEFYYSKKNIMLENIVHEDALQIVMMLEKKQKRHA